MARTEIGTCPCCGEKNVEIIWANDEDHMCESCLEAQGFEHCDVCDEWYAGITFYRNDEQTVCEWCAEDMDEDELEEYEAYEP